MSQGTGLQPLQIKAFAGLRNTVSPERMAPGELEVAVNVDIDDSGKLLTRLGTTLKQAGAYHSLFADEDMCLVMGGTSGNELYRLNADTSLTQLQTFTYGGPMSMVRTQAHVLMSNGIDTLRLTNGVPHLWGTPSPRSQPAAAPGAGQLPPGDYRYAMTFVRADGFESGTGISGLITLSSTGGIAFSGMESSSDPDVVSKVMYISSPNGRELFRAFTVDASVDSYSYNSDGTDLTVRLETQFCTEAPAGTIVEIYNGVAYSVLGDTAFYSDPYAFDRFRPRTQFMRMPDVITMWACVNDGIYASTPSATYFLQGGHPTALSPISMYGSMTSRKVLDYGAIPGTVVHTTAGVMESLKDAEKGEPGDLAIMFTTPYGICFGMDGGKIINMTDRIYSFPTASRGRAILKSSRGYTQYKVALENSGVASNAYA